MAMNPLGTVGLMFLGGLAARIADRSLKDWSYTLGGDPATGQPGFEITPGAIAAGLTLGALAVGVPLPGKALLTSLAGGALVNEGLDVADKHLLPQIQSYLQPGPKQIATQGVYGLPFGHSAQRMVSDYELAAGLSAYRPHGYA